MAPNLFILGATGRTGRHLVELALARSFRVTAFVRSPHKLARSDAALAVVQGDPLQADQLARALPGHDAVLSVLGPTPREAIRPHRLLAECAASTVAAMESAGPKRLVVLSAALLFPDQGLRFAVGRWLLRNHVEDLEEMEAVVQATAFDWTIARPPRLVEAPEEAYRSAAGALPPGRFSMSFRAVARFMLDCAEQATFSREVVGLRGPSR
ncbi:NAD(P)-dependent oxidoreductase [Anaeromyxobacter oryzae]|uniref:NADH-flavin reductase n=1 Tax=Anaeromyxobacter oryzae TaxID=2918170 RepID=A0ABM7WTV9_9BACT|nr:NAD(P)H-binding protein [Anaeromyxobacter oryzae]BDG02921.1 NADH-flavin reductase [Anaeromyxobacter oryzae]